MTQLGKLVTALARIRSILDAMVNRSPWIATDQKDGILKSYDEVLEALTDAHHRSNGNVPFTKSAVKQWERRGREIEIAGKN